MPLSCHYHRLQLEQLLDRGMEPFGATLSHVKSCGHCQKWYQHQRRMIASLRRQAREPRPQEAPQLLPGVLAAIRNLPDQAPESTRPAASFFWTKWLAPAATVCLAILAVTQWDGTPDPSTTRVESAKWLALSPEALVQQTTGQSIHEWGQQLDQPLEQEWMFLKEDAKATIGGMAGTFLPSKFGALYQGPTRQQP